MYSRKFVVTKIYFLENSVLKSMIVSKHFHSSKISKYSFRKIRISYMLLPFSNIDMFNKKSQQRNRFQLYGHQVKNGYDWWWHSFTAYNKKTGEARPFFLEFFLVNPKYGKDYPIFGQHEENIKNNTRPSYLMVKMAIGAKERNNSTVSSAGRK